jgi:uncharacterized protein YdaU (DUF1376 family)
MANAPWYKRFAADFVADPYVQAMSAEQYGWYSAALDMMWIHTPQGYLPNDEQLLSKMIGRCDHLYFATHAKIVLERFQTTQDGKWLFHPKMIEQVDHISQVSEKRSDAGKKGAEKRVANTPSKCQANAQQLPTDSDVDSDSDKRGYSDPTPDDLNEREYALRILEDLGLPAKPNLVTVSDSVVAYAKKNRVSKAQSFEFIRRRALDDQKAGKLDGFWFRDGKYNPEAAAHKPVRTSDVPLGRAKWEGLN